MHLQLAAVAFISLVLITCAPFHHHHHAYGFSLISAGSPIISTSRLRLTRLCSETFKQQQQQDGTNLQPLTTTRLVVDMKMSEIKAELIGMNVSFADCFDRESMEKRLLEARESDSAVVTTVHPTSSSVENIDEHSSSSSSSADIKAETCTKDITEFDRATTLIELRQLSVRELKVKLSEIKVRWGTMIEKEEMVQALCETMEARYIRSKNFSRSGILIPGSVTDVNENTLMMELGWSDVNQSIVPTSSSGGETNVVSTTSAPHTPILLDVYATWCGPCQFMSPLLSKAAEELGPDVRVVKLDSDKYPRISGALKGG